MKCQQLQLPEMLRRVKYAIFSVEKKVQLNRDNIYWATGVFCDIIVKLILRK